MNRQRGVALITVLLVVAIVTLVSAGMVARQHLSIRSSANQLQARQAWQYALGGELLAKAILRRDLRRGALDHPGEPWAQPLPPFPIDQGEVRVRIEDLAGRFNLNSLVQSQQPDDEAVAQFRRLLALLDLPTPYAERLVDWLDADQQTTGDQGAEDNAYLLRDPPYRTAGRALVDVSELRLLGMGEAELRRLAPHVAVLPAETPLNVNTADALVLASLAAGLPPALAETLVRTRPPGGFRDAQAFLSQPLLADRKLASGRLAVSSSFFRVVSEVRLAERRLILVSQLERSTDGTLRVLQRNLGEPPRLEGLSDPGD